MKQCDANWSCLHYISRWACVCLKVGKISSTLSMCRDGVKLIITEPRLANHGGISTYGGINLGHVSEMTNEPFTIVCYDLFLLFLLPHLYVQSEQINIVDLN